MALFTKAQALGLAFSDKDEEVLISLKEFLDEQIELLKKKADELEDFLWKNHQI